MARTVLVCGSRRWKNRHFMEHILKRELRSDDVVIHGDCAGADRMAAEIAESMGCQTKAYPADWAKYGRRAGSLRNMQMLTDGKPDYVIAFPLGGSPGTSDMVMRASNRKIPVLELRLRGARSVS